MSNKFYSMHYVHHHNNWVHLSLSILCLMASTTRLTNRLTANI